MKKDKGKVDMPGTEPFTLIRFKHLKACMCLLCLIVAACNTSPVIALHPFSENQETNAALSGQRVDHLPTVLHSVSALYPSSLGQANVSGDVVLTFTVAKEGVVKDIRVLSSTDIRFANAAKVALLQWRFAPATSNGRQVDCRMQLPMKFTAYTGS